MQLKTILNHVEKHKSFVYQEARWANPKTKTAIEIPLQPRKNGQAICSGCGRPAPGYDRLPERRFEYVPLWRIAVFLVYAMRRVNCPTCGVRVKRVAWCEGKHSLTTTDRWFLAGWAKRLSWKGVAEAFGTTWQNVFRSVKHAVSWGLAHRDLSGIAALGVDEVQWRKGHKYLSGDVQWHVDCGANLAFIHAHPEKPCVKDSTLWPTALREKQYDVVSVQPHYGTTLAQDVETISAWMKLQPKAVFVIHSGWAFHAQRAGEFESYTPPTQMTHSPGYLRALVAELRRLHPGRELRQTHAQNLLAQMARAGASKLGFG